MSCGVEPVKSVASPRRSVDRAKSAVAQFSGGLPCGLQCRPQQSSFAFPPPLRGRDRERGFERSEIGHISRQVLANGMQHTFHRFKYVLIANPQNAKSFTLQIGRPCQVSECIRRVLMARTVHFNDQTLIETNEIRDVAINRHLTAKPVFKKTLCSEFFPKPVFRTRLVSSETSGLCPCSRCSNAMRHGDRAFTVSLIPLSPTLPRKGGEGAS